MHIHTCAQEGGAGKTDKTAKDDDDDDDDDDDGENPDLKPTVKLSTSGSKRRRDRQQSVIAQLNRGDSDDDLEDVDSDGEEAIDSDDEEKLFDAEQEQAEAREMLAAVKEGACLCMLCVCVFVCERVCERNRVCVCVCVHNVCVMCA